MTFGQSIASGWPGQARFGAAPSPSHPWRRLLEVQQAHREMLEEIVRRRKAAQRPALSGFARAFERLSAGLVSDPG